MKNSMKIFALFSVVAVGLSAGVAFAACAAPKSRNYTEKELAYMSATELLAKFKTCEIKPSEVLEAQISRVERRNVMWECGNMRMRKCESEKMRK